MGYQVRETTAADEAFLWLMLYAAAYMEETGQSLESAKRQPELARYVEGWGREGDAGCIAVSQTIGEPVSAAWVRLFKRDEAGYGYINDETPELVIGTVKEQRSRGAGTQALLGLMARCKTRYTSISLSVRAGNPAVRLYERLGFRKVAGTESVHRAGTTSYTMLLSLR